MWRDLYQAECDMQDLGQYLNGQIRDPLLDRILRQCGRELLLLQSSDWPFMITMDSTPDHARTRFSLHYQNFVRLREMVEQCVVGYPLTYEDMNFLDEVEEQDWIFPELDPEIFWQTSTLEKAMS